MSRHGRLLKSVALRFAPLNNNSLIIILYSRKTSYDRSSTVSLLSVNYEKYAHNHSTAMWRGVRPSLSLMFTSARYLINSSTFLSSLKTTAKCNGLAENPLIIFGLNVQPCFPSNSSCSSNIDMNPEQFCAAQWNGNILTQL